MCENLALLLIYLSCIYGANIDSPSKKKDNKSKITFRVFVMFQQSSITLCQDKSPDLIIIVFIRSGSLDLIIDPF